MMHLFGTYAHAAETAHEAGGAGISIHLASEQLGTFFGVPITNTLFTTWVSMAVLLVLAVVVGRNVRMVPGKLQSIFEALIEFSYKYIKETLGDEKQTKRYYPIIMTIFLFILSIN